MKRFFCRSNTLACRVQAKAGFAAVMLACALAGVLTGGGQDAAAPAAVAAPELPRHWAGRPLRPLALSAVEQRFAERFPGHIQRATDGHQIVVLRSVTQPTRMLHPAADCYRGLGYRIEGERLEQLGATHPGPVARVPASSPAVEPSPQPSTALPSTALLTAQEPGQAAAEGGVQRCFTARQGQTVLRVCEYIEDAHGQRFADTSSWYWSALSGASTGPWRAVTVTRALDAPGVPV